jgi:hypothetical protein
MFCFVVLTAWTPQIMTQQDASNPYASVSTISWWRMEAWRYSFRQCSPLHEMKVSGQVHASAALLPVGRWVGYSRRTHWANSVQMSPSCEASCCWAAQEIPIRNRNIYYRVHNWSLSWARWIQSPAPHPICIYGQIYQVTENKMVGACRKNGR